MNDEELKRELILIYNQLITLANTMLNNLEGHRDVDGFKEVAKISAEAWTRLDPFDF